MEMLKSPILFLNTAMTDGNIRGMNSVYLSLGKKVIIIAVICLLACLCVCGIQDIKSRKISNLWILAGAAAGIWFRGIYFLACATVVLAVSYWLYYFRLAGAADLKVMAVICGYLGLRQGLGAIASGIVLSAAGSLIYLGVSKKFKLIMKRLIYLMVWFRHMIQTKERIAYDQGGSAGEAITIPLGSYLCAGTMLYLLISGWKGGL